MPTILSKVLEMDEFKNSGVTEEELRLSITEKFAEKKQDIINKAREKLKKLREEDKK